MNSYYQASLSTVLEPLRYPQQIIEEEHKLWHCIDKLWGLRLSSLQVFRSSLEQWLVGCVITAWSAYSMGLSKAGC